MSKPYGVVTKKFSYILWDCLAPPYNDNKSSKNYRKTKKQFKRWYEKARRRDLKAAMQAELQDAHLSFELEEMDKLNDYLYW